MSAGWLDTANAPMVEWGLESADVFGGVVVVDLAVACMRVALTTDFVSLAPVVALALVDEQSVQ